MNAVGDGTSSKVNQYPLPCNDDIHRLRWRYQIQRLSRNWCARLPLHLPHTFDEPPPFSPLICRCHCNSNRMMHHRDSQLQPSIHSLHPWNVNQNKAYFDTMRRWWREWSLSYRVECHSKGSYHRCVRHQDQWTMNLRKHLHLHIYVVWAYKKKKQILTDNY